MANFSDLSTAQLVWVLTHEPISEVDQAAIVDRIKTLRDSGELHSVTLRDPVTLPQVIAAMTDPAVTLNDKFKMKTAIETAADSGLLTSLAGKADAGLAAPSPSLISGLDWVARAVKSVVETVVNDPTVSTELRKYHLASAQELESYLFGVGMDLLKYLVEKFADATAAATPIAAELAGTTMNQILGIDVKSKKLYDDFTGTPSRDKLVDIGTEFQKVVTEMFPLDYAKDNVLDRGKRDWSQNNLAAFMGTNMAFQLRSLTIGTIASFVPKFNLEHLEGLHQSINWAYGFGFLSWTVISAVMNVTTTKPLTEYYNSVVKGNDLSESEALHAFVEKRLSRETLNKILDNQGMRDDIRDIRIEQNRVGFSQEKAVKAFIEGLIDKATLDKALDSLRVRDEVRETLVEEARPQLTESDLQQGYNHSLFTDSDITDYYKRKGFSGFNLQAKIDLAKDDRLFKLQEQLTNDYFRAYVLGKVTQDEFHQWLASQSYKQIEIDIWERRAQLEMKPPKERDFTASQIVAMVAKGAMEIPDGKQRLLKLGYDDQEATDLLAFGILNHAIDQVPKKVKDAYQDEHPYQGLLSAALQVVIQLDPTYPLRHKDFVQQIQRLIELSGIFTPGAGGSGTPPPTPPPPTPTGLVATLVGTDTVQLSWTPVNGLVDYQVYRRDIGSSFALPIGVAGTLTTATDKGVLPHNVYTYTVRSKVAGVESPDSNAVQITIP